MPATAGIAPLPAIGGPIVGAGGLQNLGGFGQPLAHTWMVLLVGSDESRRAVQFVLPLVRNIDTLYFVNAMGGRSRGLNPDIVEANYPMTSAGVTYANDNDRVLHKNKLVLANAMSEMQTGYANRPAPRILSHVYYDSSLNDAIERAIIDTRADTVVLGSSGLGQKHGVGSVASWVVANAHTNVLVVPPASLDHKAMRHMHVRDKPYQKEKRTHRVFGRDRDVDFFSS
jgi:nucleotide-binding universal stress UspA family protein